MQNALDFNMYSFFFPLTYIFTSLVKTHLLICKALIFLLCTFAEVQLY